MKPVIIIAITILIIGVSITSISAQSQSEIPVWVKGVADFWVKGNISDSDFGESISFLIEQDIIHVDMVDSKDSETVNKIMMLEIDNRNLEIENKKLKNDISVLESKNKRLQNTVNNSQPSSSHNTQSNIEKSANTSDAEYGKYACDGGSRTIDRVTFDIICSGIYYHEDEYVLRFDFEITNKGRSDFTFNPKNVSVESCIYELKNDNYSTKSGWSCVSTPLLNARSSLGEITGNWDSTGGIHSGSIIFDLIDKELLENGITKLKFQQYHDSTERTFDLSLSFDINP